MNWDKRRGLSCNCRSSPCHHHPSQHKVSLIRLRHFFKPKMIVFLGIIVCWADLLNSMTALALYQQSSAGGNNALGYYYHQQPRSQQQGSQHHHHQHRSGNLRMRAPHSLNQLAQLASSSSSVDSQSSVIPLGGAGITTLSDEANIAGTFQPGSGSSPIVGPGEVEISEARRKRTCEEPSIATRGLLGPTLKRSYFAFTQDEVEQKTKDDEYRESTTRKKRDIQHQQLAPFQMKRNGAGGSGGGGAAEVQDSPLPWTCETKYEWKDMGSDHYPRFVRTAECKSRLCFNGFFRCRPRRYKTKVLKRLTPTDSTSCEDDDVSLPETLRTNWKFVTVTINLCCDCSGRIPGNAEV